jgi:hypothetical protein
MATSGSMTTAEYLIFWCPIVLTILIVFGMKYFSAAFQARARLANDTLYRELAEKTAAAQSENQATLSEIRAELATVATSVAAVAKILHQVE